MVVRTYPDKGLQKSDLAYLRESRLVIVFTMDYQLVDAVKPELEEVMKKGGKVYAVGGSYNDNQKAMGILYDGKWTVTSRRR